MLNKIKRFLTGQPMVMSSVKTDCELTKYTFEVEQSPLIQYYN